MGNPDFSDFNALDSLYIFTRYICTASLHHCIHHGFLSGSPNRDVALLLQGLPRREPPPPPGGWAHHDPPWPTWWEQNSCGVRYKLRVRESLAYELQCHIPDIESATWIPKRTMHPASAIEKCISGPLMATFTRFHKCISGGCFGLRLEDESGLYVVLVGDGAQRTNRHRSIGGHWAVPQAPESRTKAKRLQKLFGSGKSTTLHSAFRHVQTCSDMFKEFHQFCTELQYEQNPVAPTLWALKP